MEMEIVKKYEEKMNFILKLFNSLRSSFWSFALDWWWVLTPSKQFTNSLDVLLLLLLLPLRWHDGTDTLAVVGTPLTFALLMFPVLAPTTFALTKLPFFACWSICEISSTCSLIKPDVLTIFFTWSDPNGDGISCFKTVNADDNDKKESL